MAKDPTFTPRVRKDRPSRPHTCHVPEVLQQAGWSQRHFATRVELMRYIRQMEAAWRDIAALRHAQAILPPGVTILDACRDYVERHREAEASIPYPEAVEEYLAYKEEQGCKPRTLEELRLLNRLDFGGALLSELDTPRIQRAIDEFDTWNKRKRYKGLLGGLMLWADRRGHRDGNPVAKVEIGKKPRKERYQILTNEEVRTLLTETEEFIPFFIFAIYTGARTGEIQRLRWEDINWEEGFVTLEATKEGYTGYRPVPLPDCALAWLEPYQGREGEVVRSTNFLDAYRAVRIATGIPWVENLCRHTFASNHLAYYGDMEETRRAMNHEDYGQLRRHYVKAVTKKHAEEFYSLLPSNCIT